MFEHDRCSVGGRLILYRLATIPARLHDFCVNKERSQFNVLFEIGNVSGGRSENLI